MKPGTASGGITVLGLAGSPRRGGNTDLLLDAALAGAADRGATVEKIVLNRLRIRTCQHCDGCIESGVCIVKDDMSAMHRKLREADHIILASPIFFMGVTAQTKAFIDRCQALWVAKYQLKQRRTHTTSGQRRKGIFISASGMTRPDIFLGAIVTVKAFFATCDVAYSAELLFPGVDGRGEINHHPTALEESYAAGAGLAPLPAKVEATVAP